MKIHQTLIMIICLLVGSQATCLAQATVKPDVKITEKGLGKIAGNVVDSISANPVEYVTVALFKMPDLIKPVNGAMSDDKGKFTLSELVTGSYAIKISSMGYQEKWITAPKVDDNTVALKNVKLSSSARLLNEVSVTGQASLIEEKVDRLVYNAEKDLTAKGGDATEILRNVPLLSVDLDGNVSLRGSQNIRVLINNKPSTILAASIADALKQIPADQIKSVEVITSPSAKYDAEGSGGIINIITKKNNIEGMSLTIDSGIGNRASTLGLSGSYRKRKFGINLNGSGRAIYNKAIYDFTQHTILTDITTNQYSNAKHLGGFGNYALGLDYDLKKNESLSAGVRFGTRGFSRKQDMSVSQQVGNAAPTLSGRDIDSKDFANSVDVNLDYIKIIRPQTELSISTLYSRADLTNNSDASLFSASRQLQGTQKNDNKSNNQEATIQADYTTPINKFQLLEFGAKGIFRSVKSNYSYSFSQAVTSPENLDITGGNLEYGQNVGAAYLSYMLTTRSKWTVKAGARYELTAIDASTRKTGKINIPTYQNLVPSIAISKAAGPFTFKGGYNRRIQRPGIQQLNPNINIVNPQNLMTGNLQLRPELTDNYELSSSGPVGKFYINAAVFTRQTARAISQVRIPIDSIEGATLTTYQNIGKQHDYGANLYVSWQILPVWSVNGSIDAYYSILNGVSAGRDGANIAVTNHGWYANKRFMTQISLPNNWKVQANGMFNGKALQLQGRMGGYMLYSFGFRKDFKGNKGSLGITGDNIFSKSIKVSGDFSSPLFVQTTRNQLINRGVRLTFSYKIGKIGTDVKRKTKGIKNTDVKEGEGN
ncbi:TonB-dependent receptor [Dyadobacter frigoris]|uniref:TonB-dependent receptor domain-containing protein n=1 Tax=Dyadobacter frigoris TaxID=2576211 RepID=UPI0024A11755|nr:TonB-dependent receptor [Dyadobacter frigoris]GLU51490.1 TonB-dependent receptor [Dyadobacter frigoris]